MKTAKKKCRGRWRKWREENCDENGEKKNVMILKVMEKKKCEKWRKWREENRDENGEKKNVEGDGENGERKTAMKMEKKNAENGKNGERKTLMRLRVKKEREEGEDFIMDVHVVLGVDLEEEVLGEDLMRKIRILLKTRDLLKRLKRRLTL